MKSGKLALILAVTLGGGAAYGATAPSGETKHEHEAGVQTLPEGFGVLKAANAAEARVKIAHEVIPELEWPGMTMWFPLRGALPPEVREGDGVRFELQRDKDKWVITHIEHRK